MSETFDNYLSSCHSCQSDQLVDVLCADCGPSRAFFAYPSDGAAEAPLICQTCHQPAMKAGKACHKLHRIALNAARPT